MEAGFAAKTGLLGADQSDSRRLVLFVGTTASAIPETGGFAGATSFGSLLSRVCTRVNASAVKLLEFGLNAAHSG